MRRRFPRQGTCFRRKAAQPTHSGRGSSHFCPACEHITRKKAGLGRDLLPFRWRLTTTEGGPRGEMPSLAPSASNPPRPPQTMQQGGPGRSPSGLSPEPGSSCSQQLPATGQPGLGGCSSPTPLCWGFWPEAKLRAKRRAPRACCGWTPARRPPRLAQKDSFAERRSGDARSEMLGGWLLVPIGAQDTAGPFSEASLSPALRQTPLCSLGVKFQPCHTVGTPVGTLGVFAHFFGPVEHRGIFSRVNVAQDRQRANPSPL